MPRQKKEEKMVLISIHVPVQMLNEVDEIVKQGLFPNRSAFIRYAIEELLKEMQSRRGKDNAGDESLVPGR